MEQLSVAPWVAVLHIGVFFASVLVWLQVVLVWKRRGSVLRWEPRQPVPWGPAAMLPAIAFVLMALLSEPATEVPPRELAEKSSHAMQHLLAAMMLQGMMTGLVIGIALLAQATLRDLGIVPIAREVARDIGLGIAAFLAAVAPVYLLQALLLVWTEQTEPSNHPLVKMVTGDEQQLGVFVLATVAAVVVAPVCEEILYRLILQGWLEKWEDQRLGWRYCASGSSVAGTAESSHLDMPQAPYAELSTELEISSSIADVSPAPEQRPQLQPPYDGPAGLPYGWVPILISSALFGAAHYGYGPEPVPIFLLAIILGYVYQRTHRIIPCIVAHALFNSLTMVSLWGITSNG